MPRILHTFIMFSIPVHAGPLEDIGMESVGDGTGQAHVRRGGHSDLDEAGSVDSRHSSIQNDDDVVAYVLRVPNIDDLVLNIFMQQALSDSGIMFEYRQGHSSGRLGCYSRYEHF